MKTSRTRLAAYRAKAADTRNTYPDAKLWRYWRRPLWSVPCNTIGDKGQRFTDTVEQIGDYLGSAEKIAPRVIQHTGWYADIFQDALIIGGVCRLRTARGALYVPVTSCDQWDGATHHLADAERVPRGSDQDAHDKALREAAICADRLAEIQAEEAREDSAKDRAEQDIDEARAGIHSINKECLALLAAIKQAGGAYAAPVCSALRAQVGAMLDRRREAFATITARQNDYWTAVNYR
jgi:hypothetical protein